jgi:N-acetylneuraminic acid mutarotase
LTCKNVRGFAAIRTLVLLTAAAALLQNGEVLVAGGTNITNDEITLLASTETYSPTQRSWQVAQSLNSSSGTPSATLLSDGDILVLGGPAEFSDPIVNTWTNTGSYPRIAAVAGRHAATLLGSGSVLVTGARCNYSGCHVLAITSALLYSVSGNSWSVTGSMNHPRVYHTSTLLTNGQVLVSGGESGDPVTIVGTAELYTP